MRPTLMPPAARNAARTTPWSRFSRLSHVIGLLVAAALAGTAAPAAAEAQLSISGGGSSVASGNGKLSASASLNFRIIIPPVLRLMENQHPSTITTKPDGRAYGQQRLVFMSNLKQGACFTLRSPAGTLDASQWQLRQTASNLPVSLERITDGYKVCATRPGHYTVDLEHSFGVNQGIQTAQLQSAQLQSAQLPSNPAPALALMSELPWPVQTDFNAI